MGHPQPLSFIIFRPFETSISNNFSTNQCDSNSRPSEHSSHNHYVGRPGLPPLLTYLSIAYVYFFLLKSLLEIAFDNKIGVGDLWLKWIHKIGRVNTQSNDNFKSMKQTQSDKCVVNNNFNGFRGLNV